VVAVFQANRGTHSTVRAWASQLSPDVLNGADIAVEGKAIRGSCQVDITAGGITHRLSPETFYQVNLEVNCCLVDDVIEAVQQRAPQQVLDAFAGAGNLSIPLAAAGTPLTQIESHPSAVRDARATATRMGLSIDARVQRAQDFSAGDAFFDLAIVDPPRSGVGPLMEQLLLTRPAALVMVSCNPHTLTRDLRFATADGYKVSLVRVYEMFPQTEHAEVLVVLDR
jgi:tRNA/tmRNA/rRNA uracil-C5-methylase (TrmA/RlmC/RlmD family)